MKLVAVDNRRPDMNLIQVGCPIFLKDLMIKYPTKRPSFQEVSWVIKNIMKLKNQLVVVVLQILTLENQRLMVLFDSLHQYKNKQLRLSLNKCSCYQIQLNGEQQQIDNEVKFMKYMNRKYIEIG
ncbi:unnamed protein product [Paramecium primaurelia]|uniref:Uncharacterized protein n=1 Tax=Paramecium primaurelia TaxID=5886 RepID=A0A8S1KFK3_PARPR|nr:unnamed protein product [Paramecium primaurelia]